MPTDHASYQILFQSKVVRIRRSKKPGQKGQILGHKGRKAENKTPSEENIQDGQGQKAEGRIAGKDDKGQEVEQEQDDDDGADECLTSVHRDDPDYLVELPVVPFQGNPFILLGGSNELGCRFGADPNKPYTEKLRLRAQVPAPFHNGVVPRALPAHPRPLGDPHFATDIGSLPIQ